LQRVEVLIDTEKGMINIKSDYLVESYPINELKKISKLLLQEFGPKTATMAIKVIQIWNEEKKSDRDRTGSRTLPKRTPNKLVRRIKRRRRRIRKPE